MVRLGPCTPRSERQPVDQVRLKPNQALAAFVNLVLAAH